MGFEAGIISTRPTFELARLSLLDSAGILEQDARRKNRKRNTKKDELVEPLYDEEDVLDAIELWSKCCGYQEKLTVVDGVDVTFDDAGHILGSGFLDFHLTEGDDSRRFLFSGDLGNINKPIIRDPRQPPTADIMMIESTYGNRTHRPFEQSVANLEEAITETVKGGGNVIIPTFALERAQELLYVLHAAWDAGRIPSDVKIFLDSPMAISATRIFERHPEYYDKHAAKIFQSPVDPFRFPALDYTKSAKDSIAINDIRSGAVILAGSGMVTGGRVVHHLRHNLSRKDCAVCFIGYQAHGTPGRKLVDGADFVTLFGQSIPTGAKVYTINGFSGHAGQDGLTKWAQQTDAKHVFLVHGETDVKKDFKKHLNNKLDAEVELMPHAKPVDLLSL